MVLLDTAKGFAPALVATLVDGHLAGVLAGGAAMLGHWRPLFMRLPARREDRRDDRRGVPRRRAGRGAIGAGVWILVFLLTRYASLASMVAGAVVPVFAGRSATPWPVIVFAGGGGGRDLPPPPGEHPAAARGTEHRAVAARGRSTFSSGAIVRPRRLRPFQ